MLVVLQNTMGVTETVTGKPKVAAFSQIGACYDWKYWSASGTWCLFLSLWLLCLKLNVMSCKCFQDLPVWPSITPPALVQLLSLSLRGLKPHCCEMQHSALGGSNSSTLALSEPQRWKPLTRTVSERTASVLSFCSLIDGSRWCRAVWVYNRMNNAGCAGLLMVRWMMNLH